MNIFFGLNLPKQETKMNNTKFVIYYTTWLFSSSANDWIDTNTGECLPGYLQPVVLGFLLNECINAELY